MPYEENKLNLLDSYLMEVYMRNVISEERLKKRYDIFFKFKMLYLRKYPGKCRLRKNLLLFNTQFKISFKEAKINIYGSTVTGICTNDSACDIDVDYDHNIYHKSHHEIINSVLELIREHMRDTFDVEYKDKNNENSLANSMNSNKLLLSTREKPIINFNFTSGLFAQAYKTSSLLACYMQLDERAKVLSFCFRHLAKVIN
jgi:hypothetical protein